MFTKDIDWVTMWINDKKDIMNIMVENMKSDLAVGYDFFGKSIQEQIHMMEDYKAQYEKELMALADFEEAKAQRWCYYDLLRRGAIE